MRNTFFYLLLILSILGCQTKEEKIAVINFDDIEDSPQEIIITHYSGNFVAQTDTFKLENKEDAYIPIETDRPKFVYVQKAGEVLQFFIKPGSELKISKDNDQYRFEGDLQRENAFLQEIQSDQELRKKEWNYACPLLNLGNR